MKMPIRMSFWENESKNYTPSEVSVVSDFHPDPSSEDNPRTGEAWLEST